MKRMMMAAIGTFPIVALSLAPKPATAEAVRQQPLPSPAVVADRWQDDRRDNNDHRDNNDRRNDNDRRDDWRNRNADQLNNRRDHNGRYDDRQRYNTNGRYDSNGRYDNRRNNQRRVWVPGHWESGFLGIGRHWVAGHYDYTNR